MHGATTKIINIILTARQNVVTKGLFTLFEVLVSSYSYWETENTTFNASVKQSLFQQSDVIWKKISASNTHQKFSYYIWSYKSNCAFTILHYCFLTTLLASPNSEMILRVMHILVACNRTATERSHMDNVQLPKQSLYDRSIVPEHYI
jgi:hypothetical protein